MAKPTKKDSVSLARKLLDRHWAVIEKLSKHGGQDDVIADAELKAAISRSVRSSTKTYRYVLPTQLVAKLTDPSLDSRSIQAGSREPGSFDARTFAHKVVVPFDARNHNVLGGSTEPYVNNPLRVQRLSEDFLAPQKNKAGWKDLCLVLDKVENAADPAFTEAVFRQVLIEIHRALSETSVQYPIPHRISLEDLLNLVRGFIVDRSGGDRVQAVAGAIFILIGRRLGLYKEVRRAAINASDVATGLVADLECVGEKGRIVLAVEVKDRELTIAQIDAKLISARAKKVQDILFVAQRGTRTSERLKLSKKLHAEFAAGQNIYITNLESLMLAVFSLLPETARTQMLEIVGEQLEIYKSDIRHRRDWAELLLGTK